MNALSKLKVETPTDREVRVTREFEAPAQLVWDAYTKPELLKKWMFGFDGWSLLVCEMDVRIGGAYRWRWQNDEGSQEFGFFGKFIEVTPPTKFVHQQHYDPGTFGVPMTSEPVIITTTFAEANDVTVLTVTMLYASKEERDGAIATGMTDGMEVSYQRVDALLASIERAAEDG
jgi:uncharacterized protein YndB with AHSA1/START domain